MSVLNITKGCEAIIGWRFKLDSSTPKNLTGYSVLVQIRPYKDAGVVYGTWNNTSPELTFTPATGAIDLNLPPSITSAIDYKKAVIDCWVYDSIDVDGDRSETTTVVVDSGVSRL